MNESIEYEEDSFKDEKVSVKRQEKQHEDQDLSVKHGNVRA